MKYSDGNEAQLGDLVLIDGKYKGTVVASIGAGQYSAAAPKEQWAYLKTGILIDTDFGGLVHYPDVASEHMVLTRRGA